MSQITCEKCDTVQDPDMLRVIALEENKYYLAVDGESVQWDNDGYVPHSENYVDLICTGCDKLITRTKTSEDMNEFVKNQLRK